MNAARSSLLVLVFTGGLMSAAYAAEFHLVSPDAAQSCTSGTKSDPVTTEWPKDFQLAQAEGDAVTAAVCVSAADKSAVQLSWEASGVWLNGGTLTHDCAEVTGASKVTVRPITSNFHNAATYYTCVKQ